jgi:peptide/nickel transport system substrate-binding protein
VKKKLLLSLLALTLVGAGLAQAQTFVWPQKWTVSKPADAKRGGTLRNSTISDYRTFNPFTTAESGNVPGLISANVGLTAQDPTTDDFIPHMAESWTVSANKLEITIKIRQGMKWSDGQTINADDWITTAKIHTDKAVGSNSYDTFFIDGKPIIIRKLDAYTLRFIFPKTDSKAFVTAGFTPWPDHIFGPVYAKEGAEGIKKMWQLNAKVEEIVSAGPWTIESYRPGERVTFKRNPNFGEWNKDEAGQPLPYLDKYEFLIVKDTNAQLAAFLNQDIDVYAPTTVDQISQVRKAVEEKKIDATIKVNASPAASSQFIVFNWNKRDDAFKQELFRSQKFRQAFSHVVNRQAVVDVVYGGLGTPAYSSVYLVFSNWINKSTPRYDYDLKRASQLLVELGFRNKDKDGWLVDGKGRRLEFSLTTNAGNKQREDIMRLVSDEGKKIGMKINVNPLDFNVMVGQLTSSGAERPFDAILIGLAGGDNVFPFGQNVVPCAGSLHMYNKSGACLTAQETQMDALFSRGRTELDLNRRREIGNQLQVIEAQLQPIVYVVSPNFHPAWNNRIGGEYPEKIVNSYNGSRSVVMSYVKK